jgi:hypothetical protein
MKPFRSKPLAPEASPALGSRRCRIGDNEVAFKTFKARSRSDHWLKNLGMREDPRHTTRTGFNRVWVASPDARQSSTAPRSRRGFAHSFSPRCAVREP